MNIHMETIQDITTTMLELADGPSLCMPLCQEQSLEGRVILQTDGQHSKDSKVAGEGEGTSPLMARVPPGAAVLPAPHCCPASGMEVMDCWPRGMGSSSSPQHQGRTCDPGRQMSRAITHP